tara:strand:+ start:457 stop:1761 length:1305 start_codon:yes stop_codon:yes gene_type:complete
MSFLTKPINEISALSNKEHKIEKIKEAILDANSKELQIEKLFELIEVYEANKKFLYAQYYTEELLKKDQKNLKARIKLARYYLINSHATKSINLVKLLKKEEPNNIDVLSLFGEQSRLLGNYKDIEKTFKKILEINPTKEDTVIAYSNICGALVVQKKFKEALKYGIKGYKINTQSIPLLMNLINSLLYNDKFEEAFKRTRDLEKIEPLNPIVGSVGLYLAEQLGLSHKFKIYSDPFDYIKEYTINFSNQDKKDSKDELINVINKIPREWEPADKSTESGFQTESLLFSKYRNEYPLERLSNIIISKIQEYKNSLTDSENLFVSAFPKNISINGWAVILKKSGKQRSHNHPAGWISGVLYLKVPKKLVGDEGKIEFSTYGYNYPKITEKIRKKAYSPKEGQLILFPSLLYHGTLPFQSDEDRISIAFDVHPMDD